METRLRRLFSCVRSQVAETFAGLSKSAEGEGEECTSLEPIQWLTADPQRVVSRRLDRERPVIIDGVLVLDALDQIGRKADFLVCVEGGSGIWLAPQIAAYRSRQKRSANFRIAGYAD